MWDKDEKWFLETTRSVKSVLKDEFVGEYFRSREFAYYLETNSVWAGRLLKEYSYESDDLVIERDNGTIVWGYRTDSAEYDSKSFSETRPRREKENILLDSLYQSICSKGPVDSIKIDGEIGDFVSQEYDLPCLREKTEKVGEIRSELLEKYDVVNAQGKYCLE